jgi:hypothetical protein
MIRILIAIVTLAVIGIVVFHPHKQQKASNLVKPITQVGTGWTHDYKDELGITFSAEGDAARIDIPKIDAEPSHVQCFYKGLDLTEGTQYRLRFDAKASNQFVMRVQAAVVYRDFPNAGLDNEVPLVDKWLPYSYTFTAHGLNGHQVRAPLFLMGTGTGTVWIKNVVLEEI